MTEEGEALILLYQGMNKFREGWRIRGIPDELGETVAEHSVKVQRALLFYDESQQINREKAVHLALQGMFHDIAEMYGVRDYTPFDKKEPEERIEEERMAMEEISRKIPAFGVNIKPLWEEYVKNETPEAQLVHQLDKMDPTVQALTYEREFVAIKMFYTENPERMEELRKLKCYSHVSGEGIWYAMREMLQELYPYTRERLSNPILITTFEELMKREESGVEPYTPYYTLLMCGGDRKKYEMTVEKLEKIRRK